MNAEEKARTLVGSRVDLTLRKHRTPEAGPFQMKCTLLGVGDGFLLVRRPSGMSHAVPLADQHMAVEDVSPDEPG
jgi:hypothetical protein